MRSTSQHVVAWVLGVLTFPRAVDAQLAPPPPPPIHAQPERPPVAPAAAPTPAPAKPVEVPRQPTVAEAPTLLKAMEDKMRAHGDLAALLFLRHNTAAGEAVAQLVLYRRDNASSSLLLVTRPKAIAGLAYLRSEDAAQMFDPSQDRWRRHDAGEGCAGAPLRLDDLLPLRLSTTHRVVTVTPVPGRANLTALGLRPSDTGAAALELWVDLATKMPVRLLEGPGKAPLRSVTYADWQQTQDGTGRAVSYPRTLTLETPGVRTSVVVQRVDISAFPPNLLTRAWVERQSR